MNTIWTKMFWMGAGERSIKSAIQGFFTGAGMSVVATQVGDGAGVLLIDVPWLLGLNTAAVMAIFSLGTSIGNANFTAGVHTEESRQIPA